MGFKNNVRRKSKTDKGNALFKDVFKDKITKSLQDDSVIRHQMIEVNERLRTNQAYVNGHEILYVTRDRWIVCKDKYEVPMKPQTLVDLLHKMKTGEGVASVDFA